MPKPLPNRVCAMRHYGDLTAARLRRHADITDALAYAAELRGEGHDAARMQLCAMWLDARAAQISTPSAQRHAA